MRGEHEFELLKFPDALLAGTLIDVVGFNEENRELTPRTLLSSAEIEVPLATREENSNENPKHVMT